MNAERAGFLLFECERFHFSARHFGYGADRKTGRARIGEGVNRFSGFVQHSDFGSAIPDRDFPIQQRLDALVLPVGTHSRCKQAHAGQYTKMEYFFFMIFLECSLFPYQPRPDRCFLL
ncbi:MAG: hypothetical protein LUG25_00120 [Oscillospiraceae bacterium]|nr:hypothetical protein [Oscillospiraceae bacterium]